MDGKHLQPANMKGLWNKNLTLSSGSQQQTWKILYNCPKTKNKPKLWGLCHLPYCEKVSERFRHLHRVNGDKTIMHPYTNITFATSSTTLSNFIFMVRKYKINPSTVDVKRVTKISFTHSTAFNMPPRSSRTPGTIPKWLSWLYRLQKNIENPR